MKFPDHFSIVDRINLLQRWIIVHSIIYYTMDTSVVPDSMFDENCNQLVQLMRDNSEELKQSRYYYCMYDFDGSTGMHLPSVLTQEDFEELNLKAMHLVNPPSKEPKTKRKKATKNS